MATAPGPELALILSSRETYSKKITEGKKLSSVFCLFFQLRIPSCVTPQKNHVDNILCFVSRRKRERLHLFFLLFLDKYWTRSKSLIKPRKNRFVLIEFLGFLSRSGRCRLTLCRLALGCVAERSEASLNKWLRSWGSGFESRTGQDFFILFIWLLWGQDLKSCSAVVLIAEINQHSHERLAC